MKEQGGKSVKNRQNDRNGKIRVMRYFFCTIVLNFRGDVPSLFQQNPQGEKVVFWQKNGLRENDGIGEGKYSKNQRNDEGKREEN